VVSNDFDFQKPVKRVVVVMAASPAGAAATEDDADEEVVDDDDDDDDVAVVKGGAADGWDRGCCMTRMGGRRLKEPVKVTAAEGSSRDAIGPVPLPP
jgi:hypothetical protein